MKKGEILEGVVQNIRPKMLIVIDALASRSIERISSTIQISDTGIVPGAGVGNTRKEISKRTLNIPVIAIRNSNSCRSSNDCCRQFGHDCLNLFIEKLQQDAKSNDYLNKLKDNDNYEEIKEALNPSDYNMIVTPKEIDELINNMANVVAKGINLSLQNR